MRDISPFGKKYHHRRAVAHAGVIAIFAVLLGLGAVAVLIVEYLKPLYLADSLLGLGALGIIVLLVVIVAGMSGSRRHER